MEDIQRHDSNNNHDALEADKHGLVLHQGARPALAQLRHAEDAPPEDADGAERQGAEEALEEPRVADGGDAGGLVEGGVAELLVAPPRVEGEVGRAEHEHEHGEDLEGQAGDHDVVAGLDGLVVVRGYGSHGATNSLQDEREDIARDELESLAILASMQTRTAYSCKGVNLQS